MPPLLTASSIAMTMKFLTPARLQPSIHMRSMPKEPSGVMSAELETATMTSLFIAILSCGGIMHHACMGLETTIVTLCDPVGVQHASTRGVHAWWDQIP